MLGDFKSESVVGGFANCKAIGIFFEKTKELSLQF
jgi:hypothetical protein